jgi:mannose-1-phosphate guanylyltransferase
MKILIMAGGSGERFWPLSTKENPKQLLSLVSSKSMIRETVDRVLNLVDINDVFIATNKIQVTGVIRELPDLPEENIIIEPAFRDTAAAIAYGSTVIARTEKNPTIVVLASDHLISDEGKFVESLRIAEKEAEKGNIITLGIKPSRPETGYGYINIEDKTLFAPTKALKFLEKPSLALADEYIASGNYVWNSGMFIFKYNTIMNELKKYSYSHYETIEKMKPVLKNLTGTVLSEAVKEFFPLFNRISIDFAVMEKSEKIICIPVEFGWNDIGGYNSLEEVFNTDSHGNVVKDCNYVFVDSSNNIVISDNPKKLITSIGISNTIIVDTKNGLLISKRNDAQKIKEILKLL